MSRRLPPPLPLLDDVVRRARRDGLRPFLEASAAAIGAALRRREERLIVLLKELDDVPELAFEARIAVEPLVEAHLAGLHELNRRRCETRADRRFARALARGHKGYVGFVDGDIVGYYWWVDSTDPRHPDIDRYGLDIELTEGDVYGSDFFLLEEHRGGGNAAAFLQAVETDLRDRGHRRLWGYVASSNRPARWTYSSRGYRPMWTVLRTTAPPRRVRIDKVHGA